MLEEQDPLLDQPQGDQHIIDQAAAGEEGQEDVGRDNPGNEVGQIGGGLDEFLHPDALELVEHHGQDDRSREGEQQRQEACSQRVPHDHAKVLAEEILKPLESDELGVEKIKEVSALGGAVVGKGHIDTGHRRVADDQHPDDAGNHQQEQVFLVRQPGSQRLLFPAVQSDVRHGVSSFKEKQKQDQISYKGAT